MVDGLPGGYYQFRSDLSSVRELIWVAWDGGSALRGIQAAVGLERVQRSDGRAHTRVIERCGRAVNLRETAVP